MTSVARPGQPLQIRADEYNAATAAGAAYAAAKQSQGLEIVDPRTRAPDLLRVANAGNTSFARHDVVELTEPVIHPATSERGWHDGLPAMQAVTPTSTVAVRGKLAILTEPIAAGKIGLAITSGAVRTKITLCDPSHTHAAPLVGSRRLQSTADTGAPCEILWAATPAEPEEGEEQNLTVDALVRISNAHEPLTAFQLTARADTLDDFPKAATRIDADGAPYGDPIAVRTPHILPRIYGPADIGFQGWAVYKPAEYQEGDPCTTGHWQIIHMQRFAEYIQFSGADFTSNGCLVNAEAAAWWHGEQPTWSIKVDASHLNCICLGDNATGIAVLDERASAYPYLVYRVVDVDQMLYTADADDCVSNPCASGEATRVLITGDGLTLERLNCGGSAPCASVIHWAGLQTVASECGAEGEPGSGTLIQKLVVAAPLELATSGDCPTIGTISLAGDLITAEGDSCITLEVTESKCKYHITATFDPDCLATVKVLAGTCITITEGVDEEGDVTYTVNNAMQIIAGDCISVEDDGCDITITNTMKVVGGNGISVSKSDCTYSVSIDGSTADPKTTLRLLCGVTISPISIACVETSGGWSFSVTGGEVTELFTEVTLPASLVTVVTECGSSGGGDPPPGCETCPECEDYQNLIYNPITEECYCQGPWQPLPDGWVYCHDPKPVLTCDDCPDCEQGYRKIIRMGSGDCDCITHGAPLPQYWAECGTSEVGDGEGIEFLGLDCNSAPPHFAFALLGFPPGAVSYTIEVTGDQGSSAIVGPSNDAEETVGQERWGALFDGFGSPQPGENFQFVVYFKDGAGNVVASQTFVASCESAP